MQLEATITTPTSHFEIVFNMRLTMKRPSSPFRRALSWVGVQGQRQHRAPIKIFRPFVCPSVTTKKVNNG